MYHLEAWVVVVGANSLLTGSVDSRRMLLKSVGKKLTFFRFFGFTWFLWVPNCLGSFSSFYFGGFDALAGSGWSLGACLGTFWGVSWATLMITSATLGSLESMLNDFSQYAESKKKK